MKNKILQLGKCAVVYQILAADSWEKEPITERKNEKGQKFVRINYLREVLNMSEQTFNQSNRHDKDEKKYLSAKYL